MATRVAVPLAAGFCFLLSSLAYWRRRTLAPWLGAAGTAILVGVLAASGLAAGRWPGVTPYEFALLFACATVLAAVGLSGWRKGDLEPVCGVAAALAAGLVGYACVALAVGERSVEPLFASLGSAWLPLHVGAAALSYGLLAAGGCAGLARVVLMPRLLPAGARASLDLAWVLDRSIAVGYPLLTLSIVLGMIWAYTAWGSYWDWDLKEVWTVIVWLLCTVYWHVRARPRWQGRRLAWLAVAWLAALLSAFLGVGGLARLVEGSLRPF